MRLRRSRRSKLSLMRYLTKPMQLLYFVYAISLFMLLMIPVFLWALVASAFGRIKGGNLVYLACRTWADLWFALIFIRVKTVYHEKPDPHQSYIFVVNHLSYLDSALIPKIFRRPVRPLGKVEMTRIPVFGTIYKNVIVTVDRSSAANRSRSVQLLKSVLRKGISVLVFPEGTFNETGHPLKAFYDGAFRIAIETGTPVMPVLFLDNYNRMRTDSVFSFNPGRCRVLFLPSVSPDGYPLEALAQLKEEVYQRMEIELRKREAAWITRKTEKSAPKQ